MWAKRSPGVTSTRTTAVHGSCVEPVVPHPGRHVGTFAGMKRGSLPIADDGQFAPENGEPLVKGRMQMLAGDPRTGKGGHLSDSATILVLPRQLDDRGPLPGDRVLKDLAGLDRP